MRSVDQLGNSLEINHTPSRIISLVPSQTEFLYDLGLDDAVCGITKFCVHPESWYKSKTRVGGTKELKLDVIQSLNPDLIIANKEENTKAQIEELAAQFPVWVSDVNTLDDAYDMMLEIGRITGKGERAQDIVSEVIRGFDQVQTSPATRILYLIWKDPYIGVAANTFINSVLEEAGFENVLAPETRYPQLDKDLRYLNPEVVLLPNEPYPFNEKHKAALSLILPEAKVVLADGELLSWYGSRLTQTPAYLNRLLGELS